MDLIRFFVFVFCVLDFSQFWLVSPQCDAESGWNFAQPQRNEYIIKSKFISIYFLLILLKSGPLFYTTIKNPIQTQTNFYYPDVTWDEINTHINMKVPAIPKCFKYHVK